MVRIAALVLCLVGSAVQAQPVLTGPSDADRSSPEYLDWYRAGPVIEWSNEPQDVDRLIARHLASKDFPDDLFRAGRIDLNGDGQPEILLEALPGPDLCGSGGCMLYIYTVLDNGDWLQVYRKVQMEFVFLADQTNDVWDLAISSGGAMPAGLRVYTFDTVTYTDD